MTPGHLKLASRNLSNVRVLLRALAGTTGCRTEATQSWTLAWLLINCGSRAGGSLSVLEPNSEWSGRWRSPLGAGIVRRILFVA